MINSGLPKEISEIVSPAVTKILCAYKAYKCHPNIAQFWHQTDDSGNLTSLIGVINSYANLWSNNSNTEELISFLSFLSPVGIFTHLDTANKLNLHINEKCLCFKAEPPFEAMGEIDKCQPRELLNALRSGLTIPDDDGFVADVSFRLYKGLADYVTKDGGGALLYMNDNSAILNGIAVPKENRSKGLGSTLLKHILSIAGNRSVYACCKDKNKDFYIKNGFALIGYAAYCEEK